MIDLYTTLINLLILPASISFNPSQLQDILHAECCPYWKKEMVHMPT